MSVRRWLTRALPLPALLALALPARADNHNWEIAEVFSSADGTVQFIELFNPDKDEQNLTGMTLTTASGSFFSFPSNLPSSATENKRVLIATAAFAAIPGMPTPNYTIPSGFLRRTGDTLTYNSTPDSLVFGALPVDGVTSLNGSGAQGVNSPTNFAGASGSLVLATATVRNGSGINDLCYSGAPMKVGGTWSASVNASGHPGSTFAMIVFYLVPAQGIFVNGSELLINPATPQMYQLIKPSNGALNLFSQPVPNDPSIIGVPLKTQGLLLGGGIELCNAVDLKLGR